MRAKTKPLIDSATLTPMNMSCSSLGHVLLYRVNLRWLYTI